MNIYAHSKSLVLQRLVEPAKTYVARRTAEGKPKAEIIRCLKRLLARELWAAMRPLRTPQPLHTAA